MHTTQSAFLLLEHNVGLRDYRLEAVSLEVLLAERSREEAPLVLKAFNIKL